MAQRSDRHFQRGVSLAKFHENYGTEEKCTSALFRLKWPKGFRCPKCDHDKCIQTRCRPLYQCCKCHHQTSLLDGTIFLTPGRYDSPDFIFFGWLNTIIGNIKNALIGTFHGMDHRHLPRYLGEFCFCFGRRFKLGLLLKALMYHAAHTTPVPERELRLAEDWVIYVMA